MSNGWPQSRATSTWNGYKLPGQEPLTAPSQRRPRVQIHNCILYSLENSDQQAEAFEGKDNDIDLAPPTPWTRIRWAVTTRLVMACRSS